MVRYIKIMITSIIIILILSIIASFFTEYRYQTLDTTEKRSLIENNKSIRGGYTSQEEITNKVTNIGESADQIMLSDKTPVDAIEFLFSSLELNNIGQFVFSFNTEVILMDYQSLDNPLIKAAMQEISRGNSIESVQYKELENEIAFEVKIIYDDKKEAQITLELAKAESINYKNRPFFYHLMTSPTDIVQQINNTIQ